tara:strand:+ start:114 stop:245 length:132 start_codon:yes stop_codon:yes gene_type:complete
VVEEVEELIGHQVHTEVVVEVALEDGEHLAELHQVVIMQHQVL